MSHIHLHTKMKLYIYDFMLVNNTNLHPISHRYFPIKVMADYWSISFFLQKKGTSL